MVVNLRSEDWLMNGCYQEPPGSFIPIYDIILSIWGTILHILAFFLLSIFFAYFFSHWQWASIATCFDFFRGGPGKGRGGGSCAYLQGFPLLFPRFRRLDIYVARCFVGAEP